MTATKPPFDKDHRIGRLEVVAAVHDLDNAMAYRPRLESLAWEKFPDVIDGVFDKFASSESIFRMDKLELDLGTVRPAFLEIDAIAALERALEEALVNAIHEAKGSEHEDRYLIDTPVWRLQQMEIFLCEGRPGFSADLTSFDPTAEVIWLLGDESEAFLAMLDRRAGHPHALERLSLQISEKGREILFRRLAPSQAAETIGLMKDMEELLVGLPPLSQRISGTILRQKFRAQTIVCLVQARGSPFDLQRLVSRILTKLAKQTNISPSELISSISAACLATDRQSYWNIGLDNIVAAIKAEQDSQKFETAEHQVTDMVVAGIEQWRTLFNRHETSDPEGHVPYSALTKAQFQALLTACAPDGLILEKSKILARSLSQVVGARANVEDQIGIAIFEHIAAQIDTAVNPAHLWNDVLSAVKPIGDDPALSAEIVTILLSDSDNVEQDIAAILGRAVELDGATSGQSSGNRTSGKKAATDRSEAFTTKDDRSWKSDGKDDSTSHSSLRAEIAMAMKGGGAWPQLLQKYAQAAEDRVILADILLPEEFESLLAATLGDRAMPAMQRAFIAAVSQTIGTDAAAPIKAVLLEYLAMHDDGPVEPKSFWQHLLFAVVPAAEYDEIRSRLIEILLSGDTNIGQELAEFLADDPDYKSDGSSSLFRNPVPDTADSTQDSAPPEAGGQGQNATLDHADVVRRILENPRECRALLQIYAQNTEQRARLLAVIDTAQLGALIQAATGDPKANATHGAFVIATTKAVDIDAEARIHAAILEYLASHDSSPIDIAMLWMHSLEALFPAAMSAEEKSAKSREISELLPYRDERLDSRIFHVLAAAADEQTGVEPEPDQSASQALTKDKNADFVASVLRSEEQSLIDKLRAVIPLEPSNYPLPIIRFGKSDFETIVRRLGPVDIAPIFAGIKALLDLQTSKPFIPVHHSRLAELVRYMLIADLIWPSQTPLDPGSLWKMLMERLAKSANISVYNLASRLQAGFQEMGGDRTDIASLQAAAAMLAGQQKPSAPAKETSDSRHDVPAIDDNASIGKMVQSDRAAVAAYLGRGVRQELREILARAAVEEPTWLAELARKSVAPASGAAVVAERLLFWLTPSEILEFLAPALASSLMRKAPKSGDDRQWWTDTIAVLLAGNVPAANAAQRTTVKSDTEIPDGGHRAAVVDGGEPVDNMFNENTARLAQDREFMPSSEGASIAGISPSDRQALTAYLDKGDRKERLEILVRAAKQDPAWLAETARMAASSNTGARIVAERLLYWLMPNEILGFLAPALASALLQSAPKSGDDSDWWSETIAALLSGEAPSTINPIAGANSPVPHFDRLASLQKWLDGGNVPENANEQFLQLTRAERISLLRADTVDATLQRIRYAAATLGSEMTEMMLQDIIGWAALKKGPLAALTGETKADRHSMLLRAAAASLVSTEIDLNILADPLPESSDASDTDDPEKPDDPESDGIGVSDLIAWLGGKPAKGSEISRLRNRFDHLIDNQDSQLLNYVASHFYRAKQRSRWVGLLPRASLGRLLHLIAPDDARSLHDGILLLTTAASQLLNFGSPPVETEKLWLSVFNAVAGPSKTGIATILSQLAADVADGDESLAHSIRVRAVALAGDGDHKTVAAALRRNPQPESATNVAPPSERPSRSHGSESFENDNIRAGEEEPGNQPVYIANAGLILINPFLPTFFERLDLLSRDENDKPYVDPGPAASRAVHLLQYLVTGQTASPEPLLFLNKIICGLPTGTPVASAIESDPEDIDICNGLLEGMLENWPSLHGTSIDGLRETFLQREGRLNHADQKWSLVIQRKTLDILKDQIPWNTSVIYHPWMNDPIHTIW